MLDISQWELRDVGLKGLWRRSRISPVAVAEMDWIVKILFFFASNCGNNYNYVIILVRRIKAFVKTCGIDLNFLCNKYITRMFSDLKNFVKNIPELRVAFSNSNKSMHITRTLH